MGYAIAQAAVDKGWTVDLVSGPTHLREPEECILYPVETGEEMFHQVDALFDACDILIMAAAIVDFRPRHPRPHKEKKNEADLTVEMEPVVDILKTVTRRKKEQFVVGFAAETRNLEDYAKRKLEEKNLDLIAANPIGNGAGFGLYSNKITVLGPGGFREDWPPASKEDLGRDLVELVSRKHAERHAAAQS